VQFGLYLIKAEKQGFQALTKKVVLESAIPNDCSIKRAIAQVNSVVRVNATTTLIDPFRPSSIMQVGSTQIEDRLLSLPGRSVQDLGNTQPGWIYEGDAVLRPRGSKYQTQFVIDGMPLTNNRSPSFGPEIGADDLETMTVFTAGFPAEYGRRMGGVVEINTKRDPKLDFMVSGLSRVELMTPWDRTDKWKSPGAKIGSAQSNHTAGPQTF
jgi:hypothetical protein